MLLISAGLAQGFYEGLLTEGLTSQEDSVGSYFGFWPMKSKKHQHRTIMSVILFLIKISFNGWGVAYQQVNKS